MFFKLIRFFNRRLNSFIFRLYVLSNGGFIPFNTTLDFSSLRSVTVGRSLRMGAHSRLSVEIGGHLSLGSYITTGHNFTLYCKSSVTIMDNCRFAHNTTITDSKYIDQLSDPRSYDNQVSLPIHINKNTLVYTGAIILLGSTVPPNSTVAAYAVVNSSFKCVQPCIIFGSGPASGFKIY